MNKISLLICLSVVLLAGCAGKEFIKVDESRLILGKTTTSEITVLLGRPYSNAVINANGAQINNIVYVYSYVGAFEAYSSGIKATKTQSFGFSNNNLVIHNYVSSFPQDSTRLRSTNLSFITKGITKRESIYEAIGFPTGKAIYPIAKNSDDLVEIYNYNELSGSSFTLKNYTEYLEITYDKSGVVKDFVLSVAGAKS